MTFKYIATKDFSFGGTRFKAGEVVPTALITRRVKSLGLVIKAPETEPQEEMEPVLEPITETDEEPLEPEEELLTEDPSDADVTISVEVSEAEITPDWEWIDSLESTRKNKALLDDYASEKFGIELNASEKIVDMIADFKSKL